METMDGASKTRVVPGSGSREAHNPLPSSFPLNGTRKDAWQGESTSPALASQRQALVMDESSCGPMLVPKVSRRCVSSDPCYRASLAAAQTPSRPRIWRKPEGAGADWAQNV